MACCLAPSLIDSLASLAFLRFSARAGKAAMSTLALPRLPVFQSIVAHADKPAITDSRLNRTVTYGQLLGRTLALRQKLLDQAGKPNLDDVRVALLCPPGLNWSVAQLAVWAAGGAMTPLADRHPLAEMQHAVRTADTSILIAHESFAARASELGLMAAL